MIEVGKYFFNPSHVAAVSEISKGPNGASAFSVWVVGISDEWKIPFPNFDEAEKAHDKLVAAVARVTAM